MQRRVLLIMSEVLAVEILSRKPPFTYLLFQTGNMYFSKCSDIKQLSSLLQHLRE